MLGVPSLPRSLFVLRGESCRNCARCFGLRGPGFGPVLPSRDKAGGIELADEADDEIVSLPLFLLIEAAVCS